jgi:hypothetical protein
MLWLLHWHEKYPIEYTSLFHNVFYYIVESEILRNTQWRIFHIFTSEDIDHVTFSIYTIFRLGLYNKQNITRWLEDMTFIFSC